MASKAIIGSEKEPDTTSVVHVSEPQIKNKPRDAIRVRPTVEQAKIKMSTDRQDHECTKQETSESRKEHTTIESRQEDTTNELRQEHAIKLSMKNGSSKDDKPPAKQVRSGQVKTQPPSKANSQFEHPPQACLKKQMHSQRKTSQRPGIQNKPKAKSTKHSTPKPTLVRITFTKKREKSDVQMFLRHWLIALVDEINETEIEDTESTTSVIVHFPSKKTAVKALNDLPSWEDKYTVKMMAEDVEVVQSHLSSGIKREGTGKEDNESTSSGIVHSPSKRTAEKALPSGGTVAEVNTDVAVDRSHLLSKIESLQNWFKAETLFRQP